MHLGRFLQILLPLLAFTLGGCSWIGGEGGAASTIRKPQDAVRRLTRNESVAAPTAKVIDVRQVRRSEEAARYELVILLENANAFPLPLTHAAYRLSIDDQMYRGDTVPNATVPAGGQVIVRLPAVLPAPASGTAYDVSGAIAFQPPGKLRELGYDMGLRVPRSTFRSTGTLEASGS